MSKNFELNKKGVEQLLNSPEIRAILQSHADGVVRRSGDGYASEMVTSAGRKQPGTRAKAIIRAETPEAKRDNMDNNTLLKALGG